jgi:starch synthase
MRALSVASEIYPLVKTGGLADVAGALPAALAGHGVEARSLIPGYPVVLEKLERSSVVKEFGELFGGPARLLEGRAAGLALFVIDAPHLYGRSGNPYSDAGGLDWPDNAGRFAALGRVAASMGQGLLPGFVPQIVHAHDWQAGLAAAYLSYSAGPRPGTVMTVHNLAFQGSFPAALMPQLGLPWSAFRIDGVEYHGQVGFLKAGLQLSDRVTTVSPTYAAEIRTAEGGMGLDGLLRARGSAVSGILNGIDEAVWDPAGDASLAARFTADDPQPRRINKRALQDRFGLSPSPGSMLVGVVSRLSWQKGLDLLLDALPRILARGTQFVVLGSGDAELETGFRRAVADWPGRIGLFTGYDESLAHLIQGGSDALLVPSRFEPCGLTQLCAMRYGAVPIVSRVGGLNDTVIDANEMALAAGVATGFQFAPVTVHALELAVERALSVWAEPQSWRAIQANGMRASLGWERPAGRYAELYRDIVASRASAL